MAELKRLCNQGTKKAGRLCSTMPAGPTKNLSYGYNETSGKMCIHNLTRYIFITRKTNYALLTWSVCWHIC